MSKEHQIAPSDVELVTISKHVLELLLKGPQLVSEAVIHAKTVANKIILKQRDELQRLVDAWAQGNSEALFTAGEDRKTRSQMKKNHRVGETTMTTEEVGAAAEARKRYSGIMR